MRDKEAINEEVNEIVASNDKDISEYEVYLISKNIIYLLNKLEKQRILWKKETRTRKIFKRVGW